MTLASAVALAAPAQADDANTLTVVGTSDVYDSNLVQSVIKPGYEAYAKAQGKDITLNYVSKGTGAAIAYAEAGTASALLVHAASLENQFVDQGYSAEKYGRAIFYGDYVLLGPAGDPAGVLNGTSPSNDIATAYEKIATAGAAHKARFISRGGTPGTTVQEHAIWSLTNGTATTLCNVSAANGGGKAPSTTTGDCPSTPSYPSWYKATGLTQGPNVLNGDVCNYSGDGDSTTNDCYVFTDKGTFQYLRSTNQIKNLKIVAKNNSGSARGGATELINSFHAYAINPDKFQDTDVQINSAGAKLFLDYLTSPNGQSAVGQYLASDPDGAPFLPSAAPNVSLSPIPAKVTSGQSVTFAGKLANVTPGTPPLANQPVTIEGQSVANGPYATVVSGRTDSTGSYSLTYTPPQQMGYRITVGQLTQIENSNLDPVFGDLLAPTSATYGTVHIGAGLGAVTAKNDSKAHAAFSGVISPKAIGSNATIRVDVRATNSSTYRTLGTSKLAANVTSFNVGYALAAGSYYYRVTYANPGYVDSITSADKTLTVR